MLCATSNATPMLAPQTLEHLDKPPPVFVEIRFSLRARHAAPPQRVRIEVRGDSEKVEAPPTVRPQRQSFQVVVIEVAVSHARRLAVVALHHFQRPGVIFGAQQRDLTADQLRMLPRAADAAEVLHLSIDLAQRVLAVRPNSLCLLGVITRRPRHADPPRADGR
jgi:hypothetical protein